MKNILTFFTVALIGITLASCTREASPISPDGLRQEISLRSMGGLSTRSAIDGTVFPQGYDMMVSAFRNLGPNSTGTGDSAGDYFQGILFGYDGTASAWKSRRGAKYYPLDGTLDFLALASAGFNNASNGIAPSLVWGESSNSAKKVVATVPDNSAKFDDLLYGSANAQALSASGTAMEFKHAMTSVVFTAHCNVAYNSTTNAGITIDGITINGAKHSGTLTVSNPGAGGGSGEMSAAWSSLGSQQDHIAARVWNSANLGTNASESALTGLNLTTTSKDIASSPFGEGYVILPPQDAVPFTITYTVHNGFKADGTTPLNSTLTYKFTPDGTWDMGKKNVYDIEFNLTEILISPTVVPWGEVIEDVIQIPEPPVLFGGLEMAHGPLQFTGGHYEIARNWSVSTYEDIHGIDDESTFFNFIDLGTIFEKAGFANSDGNIENLLNPLSGWRLPTKSELQAIFGTSRTGSAVNGTSGVHYAYIELTGTDYEDESEISGIIIFPDGKTMSGKALTGYDSDTVTSMTETELNVYLNKGCVFIPAAGRFNEGVWEDGTQCTYLWCSDESSATQAHYFRDGVFNTTNKADQYFIVWLVKGELPPDPANGHAYVDLGLRSGGNKILFATCNLGASSPEEYGDYFAWGETSKRYTNISGNSVVGGSFDLSNCPYHTGSIYNNGWTKYIPTAKTSYWSGSGSPDNKIVLDSSDDIATVLWGGEWRIPNDSEFELLISMDGSCYEWVYDYNSSGIDGLIITGTGSYSESSIFIPATGSCQEHSQQLPGFGYYWSRLLSIDNPSEAVAYSFEDGAYAGCEQERATGLTVRPVLVIPE